jgi:hypothetical protein
MLAYWTKALMPEVSLDAIIVIVVTTGESSNFFSLNHATQTDWANVINGLSRL